MTAPITSTASGEQFARVGELDICFETFGAAGRPPLLLVMGLGCQMLLWDDRFCEALAAEGFRVIRFDNRDVGRSTILREAPVPTRWQLVTRSSAGAAYTLDQMAADAAGLLAALEIDRAHVVGVSMGGMIAQLMAIEHADHVRSLVSIMSTTGNRHVGRAQPRVALSMLRATRRDREGFVEDHIAGFRRIGSREFDFEEEHKRARAARLFDRGITPAGTARQLAAILAAPDRTDALGRVRVPATVIHGDADPLIDISGGRATAEAIPGARLVTLHGMGHDMPRELWPAIIEAIVQTAAAADDDGPAAR
jgi:pimeloyl-ACP methyl ester carboxylesterase